MGTDVYEQLTGFLTPATYIAQVPVEEVNGKLAALSPSIVIWTLAVRSAGSGITHFPTDLARRGPMVGVMIPVVGVIVILEGTFI